MFRYIFENKEDLIKTIELAQHRADKATTEETNLQREKIYARGKSAQAKEVLEYLNCFFEQFEVTKKPKTS